MARVKIWKYRYKDQYVEGKSYYDDTIGKTIKKFSAKNLPEKGNYVITRDKKDPKVCYIHSDAEILGLEKVKDDTSITAATATTVEEVK